MACRLVGTKPLSEPLLDYCHLEPREHRWNLKRNSYRFIEENGILSRPQYVNGVTFVTKLTIGIHYTYLITSHGILMEIIHMLYGVSRIIPKISQHIYKRLKAHWDWDKMAAISQKTVSGAFSWMKTFDFWKFHRNMFFGSNWQCGRIGSDNGFTPNRRQATIWTNFGMFYLCIYASLGLNELTIVWAKWIRFNVWLEIISD